jgi:hypothetical protein
VTKEYSIYVIARNNKFIHFSNGSVKDMISLDSTPNDIARVEDNIFISSNTGLIQIFSLTAVPLRSISLVENVQGIANLYLERLGTSKGIAVVGSGRLTVYNTTGVALINSTTTDVVRIHPG